MLPRVAPGFAAALVAAGFERLATVRAGGASEVYRRAVLGPWSLEARRGADGKDHVDLGLTVDGEGGTLVGPVHRALSPAALASALPHIIASLEALARAADSLRCPDCTAWPVMREGPEGPYLACGEPATARKPFDATDRPCRRYLAMAGLIVHGDAGAPW